MTQIRRPSLAGRAALAIALMLGFHALVLGATTGAIYLLTLAIPERYPAMARLVFAALVAAGILLIHAFVRREKFVAPGPPLAPERQPRLFAELRSIAAAAGQEIPAEVYLTASVNAWVNERSWFLRWGRRRTMGLGLPLLQTLRVSHLRGVIAHEFGHYHGGDALLAPWICRTYAAIARTLQALRGGLASVPFRLYAKLFLLLTQSISRRQELAADALAARVAGSRALSEGLTISFGAGAAFEGYVNSEILPVLNAGFLPPFASGFEAFLRAKQVRRAVAGFVDFAMEPAKKNPYDSHPPLPDRLAAIAHLPAGDAPPDDPPAIALLDRVAELEAEVLAALTATPRVCGFPAVPWEEIGERVYLPLWTKQCAEHRAALAGLTPGRFLEIVWTLEDIGRRIQPGPLFKQAAEQVAINTIGAAFAVALSREGWRLHAAPGTEFVMRKGDAAVEPFTPLARLAHADLAPGAWKRQCEELGIIALDLGRPV